MGNYSRLARVLLCDDIELVFDQVSEGLGWGANRIRKNIGGYHTAVVSAHEWEFVRKEPLTEIEKAAYRPDLPMRLCRHPTLNWADFACETPDEIADRLARREVSFPLTESIEAPAVTLLFFPGHSELSDVVRSVKVAARDGRAVRIIDLVWHAQKLITNEGRQADDGIGLYRMLRYAGAPAYYVLGYHNWCTWLHAGGDPRKQPEWKTPRKTVTGELKARLKAVKKLYPFAAWRTGEDDGLDQYSKENCHAAKAIFDRLIKKLTVVGDQGSEAAKLEFFREAVEGLNALNAEVGNLIETGEREQLSELFNEIARAVGLDPAKYGGGEGPASEWRDW